MPLTDWKEFFERVEAGWEGRPAPPSLQTHPGLLPDYSKGGAPRRRGQTPMLKPIPWPRQLVAKPWEHLSKIQPTLERTIGLPKERPMQSWETSHKTEWPANPIDLDVRALEGPSVEAPWTVSLQSELVLPAQEIRFATDPGEGAIRVR